MSDDFHPNFTRDRSRDLPPKHSCVFCGEMMPVVVHAFCEEGHCERRPCVDKCQSCQDWFKAIEPEEPREKKVPQRKRVTKTILTHHDDPAIPSGMVVVKLSAKHRERAIRIARERYSLKRKANARSYIVRKEWDEQKATEYGLMGEYAGGEYLGIKVNDSVTIRGDGRRDDLLFPGGSISCKYNTYKDGPFYLKGTNPEVLRDTHGLLARSWVKERLSPDAEDNDILLVGWFRREEFLTKHFIHTWREDAGPNCVFPNHLLHPMEDLLLVVSEGGPNGSETMLMRSNDQDGGGEGVSGVSPATVQGEDEPDKNDPSGEEDGGPIDGLF